MALSTVYGQGQREEQVAQAIRPTEELGANWLCPMKGPELSLRPASDGPCDMESCPRLRASRENKRMDRVDRLGQLVDIGLEPSDVAIFDPVRGWIGCGGHGEFTLRDEELALESYEELGDPRLLPAQGGLGDADLGTKFVESAVGSNARGIFGYPMATGETGLSTVARAGIEPRTTLASGRHGNWSSGELSPWTGQNEMCSTSLCLAS